MCMYLSKLLASADSTNTIVSKYNIKCFIIIIIITTLVIQFIAKNTVHYCTSC